MNRRGGGGKAVVEVRRTGRRAWGGGGCCCVPRGRLDAPGSGVATKASNVVQISYRSRLVEEDPKAL